MSWKDIRMLIAFTAMMCLVLVAMINTLIHGNKNTTIMLGFVGLLVGVPGFIWGIVQYKKHYPSKR